MVIWLLLCALAPLLSGCAGPQKRQYEFYDAFDTVIRLTAYTRDEASFRRLCEQAEAEFLRYDAIFDRYEAHEGVQGVWALNHAQGEATPVEPELLELRNMYQRRVDGQFTVGAQLKKTAGAARDSGEAFLI